MSILIFDKVLATELSAKETDFSNFPLPIWAAMELNFKVSKFKSFVVKSRSIGKELPYPAAEPKGFDQLLYMLP